jgi:hypothetical protein
MLALIWRWRRDGGQASIASLALATALAGLAAANNPATVLWWPGLLALALTTPARKTLTARRLAGLGGVLLASLSLVLYLPLRSLADPAFVYVGSYDAAGQFHALELWRPENLLWFLSGRQFSWLVAPYTPQQLVQEFGQAVDWLWAAFLGVGLPLGLWGFWALLRRERSLALGLGLAALPHALFFAAYAAPDKDTMFLPVYAIWAIFLGVGLGELERLLPRPARPAVLALPLALLVVNLPYADVSDFSEPQALSVARLAQAEPGAIYLAHWGDAGAMHYQQIVNGVRPDVAVINAFFISQENLEQLVATALAQERAVYTTYSAGLPARQVKLVAAGDDFRVVRRPPQSSIKNPILVQRRNQ